MHEKRFFDKDKNADELLNSQSSSTVDIEETSIKANVDNLWSFTTKFCGGNGLTWNLKKTTVDIITSIN